uniref:Uncharacterized protein n=1 Tax=Syphacia muris TaxID=451379 RepID=A0A0N5AMF2_9BILA
MPKHRLYIQICLLLYGCSALSALNTNQKHRNATDVRIGDAADDLSNFNNFFALDDENDADLQLSQFEQIYHVIVKPPPLFPGSEQTSIVENNTRIGLFLVFIEDLLNSGIDSSSY